MVKYFLLCLLYGCGPDEEVVDNRTHLTKGPKSCTVTQLENGAEISCPDGTIAVIYNGEKGVDGLDGLDGMDGLNGQDGANGQDGLDGESGVDKICKLYSSQE